MIKLLLILLLISVILFGCASPSITHEGKVLTLLYQKPKPLGDGTTTFYLDSGVSFTVWGKFSDSLIDKTYRFTIKRAGTSGEYYHLKSIEEVK